PSLRHAVSIQAQVSGRAIVKPSELNTRGVRPPPPTTLPISTPEANAPTDPAGPLPDLPAGLRGRYFPTSRIVQKSLASPGWMRYAYGSVKKPFNPQTAPHELRTRNHCVGSSEPTPITACPPIGRSAQPGIDAWPDFFTASDSKLW